MAFSAEETRILRAVLDRIIPRDEFPSATEAGVDRYVESIFQRELASEAGNFAAGLTALETESRAAIGKAFAEASAHEQDGLLTALERGSLKAKSPLLSRTFFERLINVAAEGYYADPGQGGNREAASWKMIGYDPRISGRTTEK